MARKTKGVGVIPRGNTSNGNGVFIGQVSPQLVDYYRVKDKIEAIVVTRVTYAVPELRLKGAFADIIQSISDPSNTITDRTAAEFLSLFGDNQNIMIKTMDLTIDGVPLTGLPLALYETITGENFVTGEKLSPWKRDYACLSLFKEIPKTVELLVKFGDSVGLTDDTLVRVKELEDRKTPIPNKYIP